MIKKIRDFLFVPARPYSVTAPIHHILKQPVYSNPFGWKPLASIVYARKKLRQKHTTFDVNERIIEIPWVISKLDFEKKGSVLDVGFLESTLPFSLCTAGFQVTGIDIRECEIEYPGLNTLTEDICQTTLPSNHFDYVILLSTIEHIGLDTLYGQAQKESSDHKAMAECLRVLKKGGTMLITTPVAKVSFVNSFMRCYTPTSLKKLCSAAKVLAIEYYAPAENRTYWQKVGPSHLPTPPTFGVALAELLKV